MNETVTLEVQGTQIECSRRKLINHSDYFRAMFEGNFSESDKNTVVLKDVDFVAMNTIIKLCDADECIVEDDQVLPVLQASCMLQFLEIKRKCIERVLEILCVENCLQIWLVCEQLDLKIIHCKAKLMALMEFEQIKDSDYFLEMNLHQIINYFGNIFLQNIKEFDVFKAVLRWYQNYEEPDANILLKLLCCVNFSLLSNSEISEIISIPEITKNEEVLDILNYVSSIKSNNDCSKFNEVCIQRGASLLKAKNRKKDGLPCFLVNKHQVFAVLYQYYDEVEKNLIFRGMKKTSDENFSVLYLDEETKSVKELFEPDPEKFKNLDGFRMLGHKNFIYLLGGEYLMGKGVWNKNFYIYDVIQEKWKQEGSFPFPRRHFECCICDHRLYVIGGTGSFRVVQENFFWFDFLSNKWSEERALPCSGRQIKCCQHDNKLFVLNINDKCGYFFNPDSENWTKIDICDEKNVLPCFSKNLTLFSYKNSIFIKEGVLIFELKLQKNILAITKQITLHTENKNSSQTESVLCGNILYSLNKHITNEESVTLEMFDIDKFEVSGNFDEDFGIEHKKFKFSKKLLIIFDVFHHSSVAENYIINDFVP